MLKEMWELVEGGGEATMEELVKKWDEEWGEEEGQMVQEEAGAPGEVPPAVEEAVPAAPLAQEEDEVARPSTTWGQEAQPRRGAPTMSARGKERAV